MDTPVIGGTYLLGPHKVPVQVYAVDLANELARVRDDAFPDGWWAPWTDLHEAKPDTNPLANQVGGSHYKDMAIQPTEYIMKNNMNFCQGNVIKYASRYKHKNGKQDLEKAIHYLQLLIELEYPNE